jgi:CHAT domain-containing protein/Flp pilus assembly protein TadD
VHYEAALRVGRSLIEPQRYTDALLDLGRVRQLLGENRAALTAYREAMSEARETGDLYAEAVALNRLGVLYQNTGEIQKALDSLESSRGIWSKLDRDQEQASVVNDLAGVYLSLGQTQEALDLAQRAFELQRASGDLSGEAEKLLTLGAIYQQIGWSDLARASLVRSLKLARAQGDRRAEAAALNGLGMTYLQAGQLAEAESAYRQVLSLANWLGDPRIRAGAFAQLGGLYNLRGEEAVALGLLKRARLGYERLGDRAALASVHQSQALAQRDRGSLDDALVSIDESIKLIESLRLAPKDSLLRRSFFEQRLHFYETNVDVLMELNRREPGRGYDALAFEASERARARTLLDELAQAQGYPERSGQADMASVNLGGHLQPLRLREIQSRLLEKDTLLLAFFLGKERSFLWLVDQNSLQSRELPPRAEIEAAARRAYGLLSDGYRRPVKADLVQSLVRLSRMLLGNVATELGDRRLLIVADGALHYIPFAALPDLRYLDAAAEGTDWGPPPLLIDHEIVSLPSASILGALRQETAARPRAPKLVAVLADPVFGRDDPRLLHQAALQVREPAEPLFPPRRLGLARKAAGDLPKSQSLPRLPYSRNEVEAILKLVPPGMGLKAVDFAASRHTALNPILGQYQVIHFATHSLERKDPDRSGLVLSRFDEKGQPQDGFLSLKDIYHLNLSADLVVLSACATALGPETRGEGLIGLTRGFMHAGSPRVLVSLWNVHDRATSEFMAEFYRALLPEGRPAADALRSAQISMRSHTAWRSPYYWASFTLQGEW